MARPERSRFARWGCAPVAVAFVVLAAANAAGWITLPWAWFFMPVWLPFVAGAVFLGIGVAAAWAWLALAGVWAAIHAVAAWAARFCWRPASPVPCFLCGEAVLRPQHIPEELCESCIGHIRSSVYGD